MDELLQVPCELVKAELRSLSKDAKLTFTTQQEVPAEILTQIISKTGKTGWLCFMVGERRIDTLDVVTLPDIQVDKGERTPSQILRGRLFRLWEKNNEGLTQREHYNKYMDKVTEWVNQKIDE